MPPQKPLKASRLRLAAALVVLVAGALLAASCANDARDSHCEPGGSDDCISNPDAQGPKILEGRCGSPTADELVGPEGCPDFNQILYFMQDPEQGNCTASGCHGSEGSPSVAIYFPRRRDSPDLDPCETYRTLKTTSGSVGLPYVVEDVVTDPDDGVNDALQSWMLCNVTGLPGGGFPMPKPGGVPDQLDATLIRNWIICGAHGPPPEANCPEPGGT